MSDITPYSHHDDLHSLSGRLPRSPLSSITTSTAPSTYTGSYFDDGLDLVPPTQGIGVIDASFYTRPTQRRATSAWNATIAQAVSGDIRRSLARIQGAGQVAVVGRDKEKGNGGGRGVVRVPAPRQWGTFVIKGGDGVVVVVGPDGEFEAVGQGVPLEGRRGWVRGRDTRRRRDSVGSRGKCEEVETTILGDEWGNGEKRGEYGKRDDSLHCHETAWKVLTPIVESEEDDVGSPARFFMTGGAGSLPSPSASYATTPSSRTASSMVKPTIPHAITWDTSPVASTRAWSDAVPVPGVDTWSKETGGSWDGSGVGGWSRQGQGGSIKSSTCRRPRVEDGASCWEGKSSMGSAKVWGQDKMGRADTWDNVSRHGSTAKGQSWDGYERAKSSSEASTAGSDGSEGSWPSSRGTSGYRQRLGSGASRTRHQGDGWGGGGGGSEKRWAGGSKGE